MEEIFQFLQALQMVYQEVQTEQLACLMQTLLPVGQEQLILRVMRL